MKTQYLGQSDRALKPKTRVAILQAQWHHEHTDRMCSACTEVLRGAGLERIDHFSIPGSYELPLAAKWAAKSGKYGAIIVFGALVKGETDHYKVILDTCIRELGKVMYDYEIPLIMELLPVHNVQQLIERSSGAANKGIEAGQVAVKMLNLRTQFAQTKINRRNKK